MIQTLYNGIKYPCSGPDFSNIEKLDIRALPIIHRIMRTGMMVDLSHFSKMEKLLTEDMDKITEQVRDMTGYYINCASGDQKADLLYEKLGIKQPKKRLTSSGKRESVDSDSLVAIQHMHPVVGLLQDYAEFDKLRGTYVTPMPKLAKKVKFGEWRMYPNLKHTRVPSGRYACEEPNFLAMPNRTERGRQLCEGFITRPGWVFLSIDESQIEPRYAAHRSGDEGLKRVYYNEEDIYSDFAIHAFKLPDKRYKDSEGWHYPGVDKKKHRFPSKTCTLASLYDVTGQGLQDQMPVVCAICQEEAKSCKCGLNFRPLWTEEKCEDLITSFYLKYSGLMDMRREDHSRARKYAYVWDDWGRILHCAAVRSVLTWVVSATLREIANFPIQSGAQGTMHLCQAQIDDEFIDMGLWNSGVLEPQLQIHDEFLFTCREDLAEEIGHHVKGIIENCVRLDVPIKASIAQAEVWGKMPK